MQTPSDAFAETSRFCPPNAAETDAPSPNLEVVQENQGYDGNVQIHLYVTVGTDPSRRGPSLLPVPRVLTRENRP